ncbi:MAG: hypothetical protein QOD06_1090, partial [Candidatus Binatota bacterium]|nr:hypothetical protein [Candidatus Binatota bacterium]
GAFGYLVWANPILQQPASVYFAILPVVCLFPLAYAGAGLYPGFGVGAVETLRRLSQCTTFGFLAVAASVFAFKIGPQYSRVGLIIAYASALVAVPLLRWAVLSIVTRFPWWREPVILIGGARWARWTMRGVEQAVSLGYQPVGILAPPPLLREAMIAGLPVLGGLEQIRALRDAGLRVALVEGGQQNEQILNDVRSIFARVVIVHEYDLPVERVRVCNLGGLLGIEFTNELLRWQNRFLKRSIDMVVGGALLLLSLPLILLGGLLVKARSRGPMLYHQEREGLGGRTVKVWKLRTMHVDAGQRLEEAFERDPELRREWNERFKLARDPRVIPGIGGFLRRSSIDELPQLWCVLRGEMSLVGPRPFPAYHLEQFTPEFRAFRRQVRPGLTGMWQVTVRSAGGIDAQRLYDTYYQRNWSLWLDIHILARTAVAVARARGAV